MTLVPMAVLLRHASREGFAVPHFDVFDSTMAEGAVAALVEKRAPGILAVYSALFRGPSARALIGYVRARAEEVAVPLAVLLDHGEDLAQCVQAICYGCTDVMFDGSRLPLDENIARTREVVRAAHAAGVGVEAELGHVGDASQADAEAGHARLTDPDEAVAFVEQTGVDALAVAIGTAHGIYRGEPRLELDRLRAIRARVAVPLVIHGGTGLGGEPLRAAIASGIAKVNVSTDLFVRAGQRLVEGARQGSASYFDLTAGVAEAVRERCAHYIELFGAAGRAEMWGAGQ